MDADAENGRRGDAESHVGECGEEVERCIFFLRDSLGLGVWAAGQGLFLFFISSCTLYK